MKAKGVVLSAAQAELLQATRDLAKERKRAQALESRMWDLDQVGQRIKNLQQALTEETSFDWTGRSAGPEAGPSFKPLQRLPSSAVPTPTFDGPDPVVDPKRCGDARQALIETRKIKQWQTRSQAALEQRIARVEQLSAEKEAMYKKAIALCSGVPAELVEEVCRPTALLRAIRLLADVDHLALATDARQARPRDRERRQQDRSGTIRRPSATSQCRHLGPR